MAGVTRATLRTRSQQRADMLTSGTSSKGGFVTPEEWNVLIDVAAAELYDLILESDELYLSKTQNITITSGTDQYTLFDDFYKLQGMYWMNGTRRMFPLRRFNQHEIGYASGIFTPIITGSPRSYNLVGQQVWFYPMPSTNGVVQVVYCPQYVRFTDDNTALSFPIANGWEEFIALAAAIMGLAKENTDVSVLAMEKNAFGDRIRKRAANRDQFEPRAFRDVSWTANRFRRHHLGGG